MKISWDGNLPQEFFIENSGKNVEFFNSRTEKVTDGAYRMPLLIL